MNRAFLAPLCLLALGACAADGQAPVATAPAPAPATVSTPAIAPATTGRIALAEPLTPRVQQGGRAAVAIGASVLGAVIPGAWGGVAGVTAGQAGRIAMENSSTKRTRYTVRMTDGRVETIVQDDPLPMAVGTPVEFVTLTGGSRRLLQTDIALPQ